jgi:hypothetical protein
MSKKSTGESLLCPSAHPEMARSRIFGVVGGTAEEPRVAFLEQTLQPSAGMSALRERVKPIEVFRIAATCVESSCRHYDGKDCQLVTRIVQILPAVADALPACRVRADCRWFAQEGKPACLRCPQVVTQNYNPNEKMVRAATP